MVSESSDYDPPHLDLNFQIFRLCNSAICDILRMVNFTVLYG